MLKAFWRRYLISARIPLGFVLALSLYILWADRVSEGQALSRWDLTLPGVLIGYLVVGLVAALIITLFGTWAKSRLRASVLGFLAGALLALVFSFTFGSKVSSNPMTPTKLIIYMAFVGLFPGAFVGALFWEPSDTERP
jgi:hypothetical protein